MPKDVTLTDLRRTMQELPAVPARVRLSEKTLRDMQDAYRDWELRDARKRDLGYEKTLIGMYEGNFPSFEARQKDIHKKTPYAKAGDRVYGLEIVIDETVAYGAFRFE